MAEQSEVEKHMRSFSTCCDGAAKLSVWSMNVSVDLCLAMTWWLLGLVEIAPPPTTLVFLHNVVVMVCGFLTTALMMNHTGVFNFINKV